MLIKIYGLILLWFRICPDSTVPPECCANIFSQYSEDDVNETDRITQTLHWHIWVAPDSSSHRPNFLCWARQCFVSSHWKSKMYSISDSFEWRVSWSDCPDRVPQEATTLCVVGLVHHLSVLVMVSLKIKSRWWALQ